MCLSFLEPSFENGSPSYFYSFRLRNAGIEIKFVTNTSKESLREIHERMNKLKFDIRRDEIFTSLTAVRKLVDARNIRPHLVLADSAMEEFEGNCVRNIEALWCIQTGLLRHRKIGLYDIMQNISHYTGTGTGVRTGEFKNGFQTQFSGPEIESGDQL